MSGPARRPIAREHILQRHIYQFVTEAVDGAEFLAFDRGKPSGRFTHLRERARGIRKATADTLLRVNGIMPIWCEVKWPGNKPDNDQIEFGRRMQAIGDHWFWVTSVTDYCNGLASFGVPMRRNAGLLAAHHDACVAGVIQRAEEGRDRPPKAPRVSVVKATPARIRKIAAVRGRTPF